MIEIGEYIKRKRVAKNISQRELGRIIGSSHSTISRVERGEIKNSSIGLFLALDSVLDIDIDYIFSNIKSESIEEGKLIIEKEDKVYTFLEEIEAILRKHKSKIKTDEQKANLLNQMEMFLTWEGKK